MNKHLLSDWFAARHGSRHDPVCMATSPGFAAAAQVRHGPERPQLTQACVIDSRAPARDKLDALAENLRLRKAKIRLLLESDEYQLLQTALPQIPDEELAGAIRWQVKDMLRSPLEATTLDLLIPPQQAPRRAQGFVVAAPNAVLQERMLQFRSCKSSVEVIDIPELAQRNMGRLLQNGSHATIILSITSAGALLTASQDGVLYFTRNFELGAFSLAASVDARREQFDRLLLELQRSLDVIEHQYPQLTAPVLWLAPFAHVEELLTLLIDTLYLPVNAIALAELFDCTHCALPAEPIRQAALFHALGLALRTEEAA
jgi:MSHA biogenesis protein MshI